MKPSVLTVLGATGSVGGSTLEVVARHPGRFELHALTANSNHAALSELCRQHQPRFAVLLDESAADQARKSLADTNVEVLHGEAALIQVAADQAVDQVMASIVGAAGLKPTLAAARAGKRVLLANKEALVMSGDLFMAAVQEGNAEVLPIDSEHNALFQCMPGGYRCGRKADGVEHLWLTASGGPFLERDPATLSAVTPDEACAHPNWDMGRKISVDSATLMNKGLEVIEAHYLFAMPRDAIRVVIHPQSIVHSMVAYRDGSVLAQMGEPDMRTPIANALAWPERIDAGVKPLDLLACGRLDFRAPDAGRFPCLKLAYQALESGGNAATTLNAANEIAVAAFLEGRIPFTAIPGVIESTLGRIPTLESGNISDVMRCDTQARKLALEAVAAV